MFETAEKPRVWMDAGLVSLVYVCKLFLVLFFGKFWVGFHFGEVLVWFWSFGKFLIVFVFVFFRLLQEGDMSQVRKVYSRGKYLIRKMCLGK